MITTNHTTLRMSGASLNAHSTWIGGGAVDDMFVSAFVGGAVGAWGGNGMLTDRLVHSEVRYAIGSITGYALENNLLSKLAECIDALTYCGNKQEVGVDNTDNERNGDSIISAQGGGN